jgi:hypothetical protein
MPGPWTRQGKARLRRPRQDMPRPRRLPGPRQGCQGRGNANRGQARPVYTLLGLESTIDEICKYGHPNPTQAVPVNRFEFQYASRRKCTTLSEHARPVYMLVWPESTIEEICKYGHRNPTQAVPVNRLESQHASRTKSTTLSVSVQRSSLRVQTGIIVKILFVWEGWWRRGGTNRSDIGLNLSGSWQQGHSATYNTPSRI